MDTKKDIGSQVKSVLENHTVSPNDSVWQHLEEKLKEKKKKRRIFFFWLTSGLATTIVLLFLLFNNDLLFNHKNNKSNTNSIITDKETNNDNNRNKENINTKIQDSKTNSSEDNTIDISSNTKNNKLNTIQGNLTKNKKTKQFQIKKTPSPVNNFIVKNSLSKVNNSSNNRNKKEAEILNKPDTIDFSIAKSTQESNTKIKDSIIVLNTNNNEDITEKNSQKTLDSTLTKELKEGEKVIKEEQVLSKWSIFPHASIDFYGSFNKSLSKNTTINYGFYFGYLATQDITLRIGVNKLKFKYRQIENNTQQLQELSYIELPLEIKYKIIDKKVNTSILFGISYLILDEATILNNQNTFSNKSNFEDKNISLNIGLGMQTKLYKRLDFNLEPIFKYHLKPHTNESNFSIFTVSILAGLEYKF